jgi:hypothetical protein
MRIARLLSAAVVLTTLVALTAAPAMAAGDLQAPASGSAAQRSDLRALVEVNQVRWGAGDTFVPLPGEAQPHALGVAPSAAFPHGCNYTQFCTYVNKNYTGMTDRMSSCTWHETHGLFVSYVNNQTPGTRARLYGRYLNLLSYTKPAPAKGTTSLGYPTFFIRPC